MSSSNAASIVAPAKASGSPEEASGRSWGVYALQIALLVLLSPAILLAVVVGLAFLALVAAARWLESWVR
jgi:hypothetical protein